MRINIYVNQETKIIETMGHSKNEVCARVTTLMDIVMRLLNTEEVQRRDGYTMIAYKDLKGNNDLIETLLIPYLSELESLYSRQLKIEVI